jgi:IS30 family transposase
MEPEAGSYRGARVCQRRLKVDSFATGEFYVMSQHSLLGQGHGVGRRGRKRRLGIEDEYWELILAGTGTVEACERVGIGRKTGYRWRIEHGGLSPQRRPGRDRSSRYLSLLERQRIATLHRQAISMREIARRLGRSPSMVSRDLRRNSAPPDVGGYDGDLAHSRARERLERPRGGRLASEDGLGEAVQAKLELEWSPEQIAAWLRSEYPDRSRWHVCHETIYQALYNGAKGGLSRKLTKKLRHRTTAAQTPATGPRTHAAPASPPRRPVPGHGRESG